MVKSTMLSQKVSLTPSQIKKLVKGQATLLKHEQMTGGEIEIHLHAKKHRRLMKNLEKKKGYKLQLSPEELEGGNLRSFFGKLGKTIKKGAVAVGNFVKDDVVPAVKTGYKFYQKNIKPVVGKEIRKGLSTVVKAGLMAAPAAAAAFIGPEALAAQPVANYLASKSDDVVNFVGDKTGAYGVKSGRGRIRGRNYHGAIGQIHNGKLESTFSNFLNNQHPAMNPLLPPHDQSISIHGGSFRTAGGSFTMGGGMALGSPLNPILPQGDFSCIRKY